MTTDTDTEADAPLAPWLQSQLEALLKQNGHAWLLAGPSGLGQLDLALALATAWLCDQPTPRGACGRCSSCHSVAVHTHADLCVLMPEALSMALGWPLDEKTQDELDAKKRKPSKEIKVDAARQAVTFTQVTRSRGSTKVVVVFPAERMNTITANTLLKTLEEPPGAVKFILATEAAHQLLPTIRSRCIGHTMVWPDFEASMAWLQNMLAVAAAEPATGKKPARIPAAVDPAALRVLLRAAGGRPADALAWAHSAAPAETARQWQSLPEAMAYGDAQALSNMTPSDAVEALQKLCHDVLATRAGAEPRFFSRDDLPPVSASPTNAGLFALTQWSRELTATARTVEHPYNPGLMLEVLASRARQALAAK
jgi:DNA polymerase-3 subunit delta'